MNENLIFDSFQRSFSYLRLSVTDICNFRCLYCLPDGYKKDRDAAPELTVSEIHCLVTAMAELGFSKVRLTGGEPTARKDIVEIARCVSSVPGITKLCLSTNGYRLDSLLGDLRSAGVNSINISADSLDRRRFMRLTGQDKLPQVLRGIYAALELGYRPVKVNALLLNDMPEQDLLNFIEWTKDNPVTVRFIELMQTGTNTGFFKTFHVSAAKLRSRLEELGWTARARVAGDGPASEFTHPSYRGSIGVIAPYSSGFCDNCNRLRVSSRGELRLCLFSERNFSLRPLLQSGSARAELKSVIRSLIHEKTESHYLNLGKTGNMSSLSIIGG